MTTCGTREEPPVRKSGNRKIMSRAYAPTVPVASQNPRRRPRATASEVNDRTENFKERTATFAYGPR
jgi:hypothetical protein